ncbi:N,N-dimethylformamidase beta subunit family domain-containing protein [Streptacidiphilus monticola]
MQYRLRRAGGVLFALAALLAALLPLAGRAHAADPCGAGSNPIVCENSKPGTPMSDWFSADAWGDIQGFTDKVSYQAGDTVSFKVQSPAAYHIEIYRLGWYGGDGARLISTAAQAAVTYPANYTSKAASCTSTAATGLVDCGNWPTTATWTVPSDAVSGLYVANLNQADGQGLMPYPFVVRNESSHSDVVVQTADETWQAYNMWGGQNLYNGNGPAPDGRAYQVSYNRPLLIGGDNGIYGSEFEMISWLERNGYDVSYLSGVDVSTKGSLLLNHKLYMSSGHDEYWTQSQYDNVLAARKAGVNEGFFSGNEVFWKTRLAPSAVGDQGANRTLVCYKMTKLELYTPDGVPDPSGTWTGTFMDPASTNYNQAYYPPNILTGSMFQVNGYRSDAITVPAAYAKLRIWRNTSVANLTSGQTATFPTGTLGYEWDADLDNASRPSGEIDLSSTTVDITDGKYRLDWGNTYGNGTATHSLVEFRDPDSHALVFGTATVQWSWGLTNVPVNDPRPPWSRWTSGCSRRPSTSWPTWASSPRRCRPTWWARPPPPTPPHRW